MPSETVYFTAEQHAALGREVDDDGNDVENFSQAVQAAVDEVYGDE